MTSWVKGIKRRRERKRSLLHLLEICFMKYKSPSSHCFSLIVIFCVELFSWLKNPCEKDVVSSLRTSVGCTWEIFLRRSVNTFIGQDVKALACCTSLPIFPWRYFKEWTWNIYQTTWAYSTMEPKVHDFSEQWSTWTTHHCCHQCSYRVISLDWYYYCSVISA